MTRATSWGGAAAGAARPRADGTASSPSTRPQGRAPGVRVVPEPGRDQATRTMREWWACLFGLVLVTLLGCGNRLEDVRGSDAYIKDVEFVGVERFTEDELLKYLHMGETSRLPWKD